MQNIKEALSGISFHANHQLDNHFKKYDGSTRFVEKLYPHDNFFSEHLQAIKNIIQKKEFDQSSLVELIYLALGDMIMLYNKTSIEIDPLKAKKIT